MERHKTRTTLKNVSPNLKSVNPRKESKELTSGRCKLFLLVNMLKILRIFLLLEGGPLLFALCACQDGLYEEHAAKAIVHIREVQC